MDDKEFERPSLILVKFDKMSGAWWTADVGSHGSDPFYEGKLCRRPFPIIKVMGEFVSSE